MSFTAIERRARAHKSKGRVKKFTLLFPQSSDECAKERFKLANTSNRRTERQECQNKTSKPIAQSQRATLQRMKYTSRTQAHQSNEWKSPNPEGSRF